MSKKLIVILLCIAVVGMTTPAFAGGAGNCVKPLRTTTKYLGVGAAFEYNYVYSRMNYLNNKHGPRSMEIKELSQVYGKGEIGIWDYFNIYGKIGGANYKLKFVDQAMDAVMDIKLKDGLYTGAGINALIPVWDCEPFSFGIGADIQGNFSLNEVKSLTRSGESTMGGASGEFYALDGQNSLYLTCTYNIESLQTAIVPYLGGYHSWMLVGTTKSLVYQTPKAGFVQEKHYQAAFDLLSFGVVFGVDVDIAKYLNLNIEGRLVGETALTAGATLKF